MMIKYCIFLLCTLTMSLVGTDRFFLLEHIDIEIGRLSEVAHFMHSLDNKPKLKLDDQLHESGLIECQRLIRSTQSIVPVLHWWELFKKGVQKGDLFVLKELLKLLFLIYKDYLTHLYGTTHGEKEQQLLQELDQAVHAAESAEQLLIILDICYKQLMELIGQAHGHQIQQHPWMLYIMPFAVFIVVLLEKMIQAGYFASFSKSELANCYRFC